MYEPYIPNQLAEVAEKVRAGEKPETTVRTLVSWFWGSQRRGSFVVSSIREAMAHLGIATNPDFNWTYLDGSILFVPANQARPSLVEEKKSPVFVSLKPSTFIVEDDVQPDTRYRIGRLALAHRKPISITPDAPVGQAVTIMLRHDFSQLPVMTGEREVKGLISWKTLGSNLSFHTRCQFVRDAIEDCAEISENDSLFDAITLIREHDCVLVRDSTKTVTGILTAYDISATFGELAEPFLVLEDIEGHIRSLINGKFSKAELAAARSPNDPDREINSVADLTLGECVVLLQNPANWTKLALPIDRAIVVNELDQIRRIRNDVMHFDPEGTGEEDLRKLREFVQFLQRVQELRRKKAQAKAM